MKAVHNCYFGYLLVTFLTESQLQFSVCLQEFVQCFLVCRSFSFRRPIQECGTSTQSVEMQQRTMTPLHLPFFSGNMVHGLSAVLPVERVRVTCFTGIWVGRQVFREIQRDELTETDSKIQLGLQNHIQCPESVLLCF